VADAPLILIVDDNETNRYGKSRTMQRAGFEVIEAGTGTEALQLLRERMPRLVILDVQLPDIDGWEVCRRIKGDPRTASVIVLQMSATHVTEADTVRALEGGADVSLTEPIEPQVLIATVKAQLRARQAEDALRDAFAREKSARADAEAANRAKDEFLATLSHELRSPIGAVLTWVTLLRSGRLDEGRTADALAAIERNTRMQVKLIEDLLDVSRIISGKLRFEKTSVDLSSVIEAALDTARPTAATKGVQLTARISANIGLLAADPGRLQQVFSNVLSNAVKFTPAGGRIELTAMRTDSTAEIRVSDTGRGIEAAFLPHLFERFRQADSSSTRAEGGLGLGLAIAEHLVEQHGGTIAAASPGIGKGATFTVKLPLPAAIDPPLKIERHVVRARTLTPAVLEGVRVLIVDDDSDARDAIAAVLEQCGATIAVATSVCEGLALLDSAHPDVVVSDIAMPGQDGYTFIEQIRKRNDAVAQIPALALSAFGGLHEERRIRAAGFNRYLGKPVEARELVDVVKSLSARRTSA
jgi:signal transduction histidine kinase